MINATGRFRNEADPWACFSSEKHVLDEHYSAATMFPCPGLEQAWQGNIVAVADVHIAVVELLVLMRDTQAPLWAGQSKWADAPSYCGRPSTSTFIEQVANLSSHSPRR